VGNNPVVRIDPEGLDDVVIQIEGEIALELGFDLSDGLVFDTDNPEEFGIIGTVGAALGATARIANRNCVVFWSSRRNWVQCGCECGVLFSFSIYTDEKGDIYGL